MRAIITKVKFEQKYVYFYYDVYDNGFKIDSHSLQCEFIPFPTRDSISKALKLALMNYCKSRENSEEAMKKEFEGLAVDV
jgi:hypothetical protein